MHEVYGVDVLVSSGEGKVGGGGHGHGRGRGGSCDVINSNGNGITPPQGKEFDTKTTVYKRSKSIEGYNLKMKASRRR